MSWPKFKIGDLCTLMTGGTPSTSRSEYYEEGTVPWIVSGDIHKREISDCEKRITGLAVKESNARYLPRDSVLIALNGQGKTRGTVALLRMEGATCNQSIVSMSPNDKQELSSDYLFYYLSSQYQNIRNITGDKDRAGLNMPLIREITIPLPPRSEQKRIAAILDKADAIRRKRQQAIQLADDFLRTVFLDMFGDPVTNPNGWEVKPLGQISTFENGDRSSAYPSGDDLVSEGVLFLSTKNIVSDTLRLESCQYITEDKYTALSRGKARKGDLIITLRGTLGSCCVFDCEHEKAFINAQMMIIRPGAGIGNIFLHDLLVSKAIKNHLQGIGQGAAVPQLTAKQLKELMLPIPPIQEQKRYENIRGSVLASIKKMQSESEESLFKAITQKAFTGQL